jgi:hypothetical protein
MTANVQILWGERRGLVRPHGGRSGQRREMHTSNKSVFRSERSATTRLQVGADRFLNFAVRLSPLRRTVERPRAGCSADCAWERPVSFPARNQRPLLVEIS